MFWSAKVWTISKKMKNLHATYFVNEILCILTSRWMLYYIVSKTIGNFWMNQQKLKAFVYFLFLSNIKCAQCIQGFLECWYYYCRFFIFIYSCIFFSSTNSVFIIFWEMKSLHRSKNEKEIHTNLTFWYIAQVNK